MQLKDLVKYGGAGIIIVTFWALVGFIGYQRLTTTTPARSYCNDYGCTNFRDGSNWAIRNCQGSSTSGSTYTCSSKGLTGTCGTTSYCCPGAGSLWTTDMSSCNQPGNGIDCCACPSPTPITITSNCNGPCMGNANCTGGNICIYDQGYGWVCRNPACYKTTGCSCSSSTPTPTPQTNTYQCNEYCITTSDCESDLRCLSIGNTRLCRDPDCPNNNSCSCSN